MNTQQKHAYGPTTTESEDNQNIENHTIFQFLTTPMVSSAGASWNGHTDYYQPYYVLAYIMKMSM